jgi:hypothetical protein
MWLSDGFTPEQSKASPISANHALSLGVLPVQEGKNGEY